MQLARREGDGERLARRQKVPLADHIGNRARTQALGQWRCRGSVGRSGEEIGQGRRSEGGNANSHRNAGGVIACPNYAG